MYIYVVKGEVVHSHPPFLSLLCLSYPHFHFSFSCPHISVLFSSLLPSFNFSASTPPSLHVSASLFTIAIPSPLPVLYSLFPPPSLPPPPSSHASSITVSISFPCIHVVSTLLLLPSSSFIFLCSPSIYLSSPSPFLHSRYIYPLLGLFSSTSFTSVLSHFPFTYLPIPSIPPLPELPFLRPPAIIFAPYEVLNAFYLPPKWARAINFRLEKFMVGDVLIGKSACCGGHTMDLQGGSVSWLQCAGFSRLQSA